MKRIVDLAHHRDVQYIHGRARERNARYPIINAKLNMLILSHSLICDRDKSGGNCTCPEANSGIARSPTLLANNPNQQLSGFVVAKLLPPV
jgi:hypothetical protein